ncbi:MAG: hypothetical protein KDK71_08130 [Chlamydiia bacterium]|nr:hypothetical protein [Chlamydiia bacterium]
MNGVSADSGSLGVYVEEAVPCKEEQGTVSLKDQLKKFLECGGEKKAFREVLERLYGEKLIKKVFPVDWPQTLVSDQCFEILERMGQVVSMIDLEEHYAAFKSGNYRAEILNEMIIPYAWRFSWWPDRLGVTPSRFRETFIRLFQDPVRALKLGEAAEQRAYQPREDTPFIHYQDHFNRLVTEGDRSRSEFFLASRELEARYIAYAKKSTVIDGAVIPLFNEERGRAVYYMLKGQIHHEGLHAYLFVPIEDKSAPAKLLFRGTNGPASIARNFDTRGIGKRVFDANCDQLIALAKKAEGSHIEVIGHSLGAIDAQRAMALLVDPKYECKFKKLSLYAFCAPKLELDCINAWKNSLSLLSETNAHPLIQLNFAYHESDVVTWVGDGYLPGAGHDFVYCNYLIVRSNSGARRTPDHHTTPFFKDGNFNRDVDGRSAAFHRSWSKRTFEQKLKEHEDLEKAYRIWNYFKSYVVSIKSKREREEELETRKRDAEEIAKLEKGATQTSTVVNVSMLAASYSLHPAIYHAFQTFRDMSKWYRGT